MPWNLPPHERDIVWHEPNISGNVVMVPLEPDRRHTACPVGLPTHTARPSRPLGHDTRARTYNNRLQIYWASTPKKMAY
jgi:hypothetical protein